MKKVFIDLAVIAFLFLIFLAFAQLACHALDKEEKGRQQMIQTHQFHNKYGE